MKTDLTPKLVLEQLIDSLDRAATLHYEGEKTSPKTRPAIAPGNAKIPVTNQRYYLKKANGRVRIRVESTATVMGTTLTTVFLKTETGVWEVLPDQLWEVSQVFSPDQLLGVFPFFRLFACLRHPYGLTLTEEMLGDTRYVAVSGSLAEAPGGPDIAREFTYWINPADGHLHALHEQTFGHRTPDLTFDRLEFDPVLAPALFELPNQPPTTVSSLNQYLGLRDAEMKRRLKPAS